MRQTARNRRKSVRADVHVLRHIEISLLKSHLLSHLSGNYWTTLFGVNVAFWNRITKPSTLLPKSAQFFYPNSKNSEYFVSISVFNETYWDSVIFSARRQWSCQIRCKTFSHHQRLIDRSKNLIVFFEISVGWNKLQVRNVLGIKLNSKCFWFRY